MNYCEIQSKRRLGYLLNPVLSERFDDLKKISSSSSFHHHFPGFTAVVRIIDDQYIGAVLIF